MDYSSSVPFEGSTEKAFDLAVAALTSIGFRIESRNSSSLDMTGPGMTGTRQSALLGATRIQVTRGAHELSLNAELGGVQRMTRFVILFPLGLSLFLCVLFAVGGGGLSAVFRSVSDSVPIDWRLWLVPPLIAVGGNVLVWLILGPIIARSLRTRTTSALDALLNNMAVTGKAA